MKYDLKTYRLRCQGYIINLAVTDFLFPKDDNHLFSVNIEEGTTKYDVTLQEIERWRQQGPLGKLHNLAVYIQRSVQREQYFNLLSGGLRLIRDNSTRWNSWFYMIERAILLKDAITEYYEKYPDISYYDDILDESDWTVLGNIKSFLDLMKQYIKIIESSNGTLELVLLVMDFVLKAFERARETYKDDYIMAPMLQSGWSKFVDYYRLTDELPAYVTSLVMNPRRKWKYIQKHWPEEWHKDAKDMVMKVWEDYKPTNATPCH
jgi:hypothetical protein